MTTPDKMTQYQAYNMANRTLAKTRQVVMLYDGAIRFLQQAKEAIRDNRVEDRYNALVKVSDIIVGLQSCIDFERGGDVARILFDFYASIDNRVLTLHRTQSAETCDQLVEEIRKMRDAWDQIDKELVTQQGSGTVESNKAAAIPPAMNAPMSDATNIAFSA